MSRRERADAFSGGLAFPDNAGCAGLREGGGSGRHICVSEPVGTVKHEVAGPRPRVVRVFVCEAHAVGQPDPRPLTPADRAELRRRRARHHDQNLRRTRG